MSVDFATLNFRRLHSAEFWRDSSDEWLPRHAHFELQVGPDLALARVWREVEISLESGPDFLYDYLPFACFVYVDGRAETVLEFQAAHETQVAKIRVPIGTRVDVRVVSELANSPAITGKGGDTRHLALRFTGVSLGDVTTPPSRPSACALEHQNLDMRENDRLPPDPVFVVGAYRSGTSVLTWALGQHPNIWPMEETGWLIPLADAAMVSFRQGKRAARSFFNEYDIDEAEYFEHIARAIDTICRNASRRHLHGVLLARLAGLAEDYHPAFQLARTRMSPKRRWVDGTPENALYILSLKTLFPRARFISPLRQPADVVASMLRFDRAGGASTSVSEAAAMWIGITRNVLLAFKAFGPGVVRIIPFEDILAGPGKTLRGIFDALGEPDFPRAAQTYSTRINSSKIDADERARLYQEIDSDAETKAAMQTLYDDVLRAIEVEWSPNSDAERTLVAEQHDRLVRISKLYNGGVDVLSDSRQ